MGTAIERKSEAGIGILEVMIASMIMVVSLLTLGLAMVHGILATYNTQEQLVAKHKAREALESVFTARSTQNIIFDQIRNAGSGGIFTDGFSSVRQMGTDGIAGTADDSSQSVETMTFPGPDGLLGTVDDQTRTLGNFERRITISDVLLPNTSVDPDVRRITVDVRFQIRGMWRTVSVSSFISRFA